MLAPKIQVLQVFISRNRPKFAKFVKMSNRENEHFKVKQPQEPYMLEQN